MICSTCCTLLTSKMHDDLIYILPMLTSRMHDDLTKMHDDLTKIHDDLTKMHDDLTDTSNVLTSGILIDLMDILHDYLNRYVAPCLLVECTML